MTDAERIVSEALELPDVDRAEVALRILDSLEGPDPHANLDDDELMAEIQARAERAEQGERGRSWTDVRQRVEQRLKL